MELSEYIEQLLQKHNCVIVPDFGGFIANYKSAVIDEANKRLIPPSKSILFNPNLINNDGLLGNRIAEQEAISYPEASDFITDMVSGWEKELDKGRRIEIGEIGFLFKQNNQIIFEQNREVNLLLGAYGLSGISFVNFAEKPVEKVVHNELKIEKSLIVSEQVEKSETVIIELETVQPVEVEIDHAEAEDEKIIPIARKKGVGLKYLAVAAAVPLLFYAYWIPMETDFIDTGKVQIADFNPINKSPERIYETRESSFKENKITVTKTWEELTENLSDNVSVYNYQFDEELYIPIKLDKTDTVLPLEEAALSAPESESIKKPYHVIAGCFSIKSNADNLVADLTNQGYQASVLDLKGGLYRVTAGDYENRSDAKKNLKGFKNSGFSGWILKK